MNVLHDYPTALADEVTPLPQIPQEELNKNGLFVVQGLTAALAEQLVERSKEPPVVEMCKNDAGTRFKDVDAVARWQTKQRLSLPLVSRAAVGNDLELMGFGWMGPGKPGKEEPHIPGAEVTFAVRLYSGATGQGNAPHYTRAILDTHDYHFGNEGVWLEAWGDNTRALEAYEANGFQTFTVIEGERHSKILPRVYMTLGDISARAAGA